MTNHNDLLSENLRVDEYSAIQLRDGAKWARFLAIMGFIFSGLIVLVAFGGSSIISNAAMESGSAINPGTIIAIYFIAGAINFILSLFLYKFSTKALTALAHNDQDILNESFRNLKLVFKITGIIVIVYVALLVIVMIAAIAFMASSGI